MNKLRIEADRFEGIVQPFPNHFHEHYVIGLVERGRRVLTCRGRDNPLGRGHILLFNPGDSHACVQSDGGTFNYCGFNIPQPVMQGLTGEITGRAELPGFTPPVLLDEELACPTPSVWRTRPAWPTCCFWAGGVGALLCHLKSGGQPAGSGAHQRVQVVTVVTAALVLGEAVTPVSAAGTALTLAGLLLSQYKRKEEDHGDSE